MFNPGDICVVAPSDELVGYSEDGEYYYVATEMKRMSGGTVTIKEAVIHPRKEYRIIEDNGTYYWTERWLKPLVGFEPQTPDAVIDLFS